MDSSFGGFSGNSDIEQFLLSIEADFVDMVCSHSILLTEYKKRSIEVRRLAQRQVYPRIGLRLSAAKDKNTNLFIFSPVLVNASQVSSPGYDVARTSIYENVITIMTDISSPFSEGITNVAASLTAAILIKQLPLNTDIKNIDLGKDIELRAFEDLTQIVELYASTKTTTNIPTDIPSALRSNNSIYIALDIDKNTLPSNLFDTGLIDERIVLDSTVDDSVPNVRALDYLSIPDDKVAFCWYYVSGTQYEGVDPNNPGDKASTPSIYSYNPIEKAFFIKDGYGVDDLISVLADEVNQATLETNPSNTVPSSNIIVSPNRGELTLSYVTIPKKKLYPDEIDKTYDRKMASFRILQRYNYLSFDARRTSSIIHRELVILRFFTADKITVAQKKLESDNTPAPNNLSSFPLTYQGTWSPTTNYVKGDVVSFLNGTYASRQSNVNTDPTNQTTNSSIWVAIYTDPNDLIPYRSIATDYIDGLVYGLNPNYVYLDKKGPRSIALDVTAGHLKVLNATTSTASTTKYVIDTFYFQLSDGFFSVSGRIKIRIASLDTSVLSYISEYLDPSDNTLTINITTLSAEEVALEILKAIYSISQYSNVLCGLCLANALEFTAFKTTDEEIKEVIDILELPPGLEIATGNSQLVITDYKSKPRSLIITAQLNKTSTSSKSSLVGTDNKDYSVASTSFFKKSSIIQAAKDKINFMNNRRY